MDGFILVNKPKGITSQTVCNKIKRILNVSKVGHNGTLDPNATGIMIVGINKATKCMKLINEHDKEYIARIRFGVTTSTLDLESEVIDSKNMDISLDKIKNALDILLTKDTQIPPLTSSIKVNGMKLMDYQRKNIDVELKPRDVKLYKYEILSDLILVDGYYEIDIKISCSKGFYVRSLARDLGELLDGYAVLHELNRTKVDNYSIDDSYNIDDITDKSVISVLDFFKLPIVTVNDYMRKLVLNGVILDSRQTNLKGMFYVKSSHDIIAMYEEVENGKYKPIIIFD